MSTFQNAVSTDARSSTFNHIHGNQTNINYTYSIDDEKILAVLKPVELQDVPRCMNGTREDIFKTINSWLNDFRAPNILLISGSPGAGKSAIASTLVSELAEERRLASSFFCKRGDASLGNPSSLWRTVAFDFARFNADVKGSLIEFLDGTRMRDADIQLHFDCLIKGPLSKNHDRLD